MNDYNSDSKSDDKQWQQDVINRLAFAALNEQRRARRWSIFFKALFFSYLLLLLFMTISPFERAKPSIATGKFTALIEINGVIADNTAANADNIVSGLRSAFRDKNTAGIILRINSPGGSPVQAGYINDEIRRLRAEHPNTPIYAVITDVGASGGYYIAAAADEIYADKASIVGSIGVVMNSFGFTDAMDKMGIERRLYTAGDSKGFLDPFSPEKPEDVQHIRNMLDNIHQQFVEVVKRGRGERLKDHPDLFSGLVWTGEESLELGLIDGIGSSGYVAREIIKAENIIDFTRRPSYLERFADRLGTAMANVLGKTMGLDAGRVH